MKFSNYFADNIKVQLKIGTVVNAVILYWVTIYDQNGNILVNQAVTTGAGGELSMVFGPNEIGLFHSYSPFSLTARNNSTGLIETITDTTGNATADMINLQFNPSCDFTAPPYNLTLFVDRPCNCLPGCACPEN